MQDSALTTERRVHQLKGLVDLFSNLGACQDDLATHEDKQDNLRLDHAVDETRKQLGLVGAETVMLRAETLKTNGKLDVARTDNILDLEVRELGIEAQLLDDASILARSKLGVVFGLCASHHHFARSEDESGSLWVANTHDHGSKSLFIVRAWYMTTFLEQLTFGLYSALRA
jgi:hypothetical protein